MPKIEPFLRPTFPYDAMDNIASSQQDFPDFENLETEQLTSIQTPTHFQMQSIDSQGTGRASIPLRKPPKLPAVMTPSNINGLIKEFHTEQANSKTAIASKSVGRLTPNNTNRSNTGLVID